MVAWSLPRVFLKEWFWLAILLGLLLILHLVKKRYPAPFPATREFFSKHKKTLERITDIFVIGVVAAGATLLLSPIKMMSEALSQPPAIRLLSLQSAWTSFLVTAIFWSEITAVLIGLLSTFQRNLTMRKRIILLVLCLLPMMSGMISLATDFAETRSTMIWLGVIASVPGWIVNGPAVLMGQASLRVMWRIMCKLHLASGDLPG